METSGQCFRRVRAGTKGDERIFDDEYFKYAPVIISRNRHSRHGRVRHRYTTLGRGESHCDNAVTSSGRIIALGWGGLLSAHMYSRG